MFTVIQNEREQEGVNTKLIRIVVTGDKQFILAQIAPAWAASVNVEVWGVGRELGFPLFSEITWFLHLSFWGCFLCLYVFLKLQPFFQIWML